MKLCVLLIAFAALASAGCSPQRSTAVADPAAGGARDYRQMIARSRARQKSQNTIQEMQDAIQRFQRDIGRLPSNIYELVSRGYLKVVPSLPAGQQYSYDPNMGILTIVAVQPRDTLSPALPTAPELTNRPALGPGK
jgi:hypothetical protein